MEKKVGRDGGREGRGAHCPLELNCLLVCGFDACGLRCLAGGRWAISLAADRNRWLLQQKRQSFFLSSNFSKYVGTDVTSLLSVPVWIMEPFSVTQLLAEIMEYSDLLGKAAKCEDPLLRHAYVAAFLVSPYGAIERTYKPFNPILGETFEFAEEGKFSFFAEQASRAPFESRRGEGSGRITRT